MDEKGATLVEVVEEDQWEAPYASPDALGLLGFGISITFFMIQSVHLIPLDSSILINAILFGGIAQVIAGLMHFRRKNSFGMLVYIAYGMFWLSFGLLQLLPLFYSQDPLYSPTSMAMGFFCLVWALFTVGATIYVFIHIPICEVTQVIFTMLILAFVGLSVINFLKAAGQDMAARILEIVVGCEGLLLGLIALGAGGVSAINGSCGGKVQIPMGWPIFNIRRQREKYLSRKNRVLLKTPNDAIVSDGNESTGEIDLGDEDVDVTTDEAVGDLDLDFGDELLDSIDVNE